MALFLVSLAATGCSDDSKDGQGTDDPSAFAPFGGASGAPAAGGGGQGSGAGKGGSAGKGGGSAGEGGSSSGEGGSSSSEGGSSSGEGGEAGAGGSGGGEPFGGGGASGTGGSGGSGGSGGTGGSGGSGGKGGGSVCAGAPSGSPCSLFPQCGCEAGESCAVVDFDSGATACIKAGAGKKGATCSGDDECGAALSCIPGVCAPYCKTDADCGPGGLCFDATSEGKVIPGYRFCTVPCDPVGLTPCGAGATCSSTAPDGATEYEGDTVCIGDPGKKPDGAACEYDSDCTPGSWCLTQEDKSLACERLCDASGGCPAGAWCRPAFDVKVAGKTPKAVIGYCEPLVCDEGDPCDSPNTLAGSCSPIFKGSTTVMHGPVCKQGKPGCANVVIDTELSVSTETCDDCIQTAQEGLCRIESDTCSHNFDCDALLTCRSGCGSDSACLDACESAHPEGVKLRDAITDCICVRCGTSLCSGGQKAGPCHAECGG